MEIYKTIDELHLKLGCNIKEFEGGAGLPTSYFDRLSEEINLLLKGCGLFDLKSYYSIHLIVDLNVTDYFLYLQKMYLLTLELVIMFNLLQKQMTIQQKIQVIQLK